MKHVFTWLTAALAATVIGIATATTTVFVAVQPLEVLRNLAPAIVTGVGQTLGIALGSLLVLRFKVVRTFLHTIIHKPEDTNAHR